MCVGATIMCLRKLFRSFILLQTYWLQDVLNNEGVCTPLYNLQLLPMYTFDVLLADSKPTGDCIVILSFYAHMHHTIHLNIGY